MVTINVAPRRGCVDRNSEIMPKKGREETSHPAGGAWIEIECDTCVYCNIGVAPRRGCVDRNSNNGVRIFMGLSRTPQGVRG